MGWNYSEVRTFDDQACVLDGVPRLENTKTRTESLALFIKGIKCMIAGGKPKSVPGI